MPRRRIGQEMLGFGAAAQATTLDRLHDLIDWSAAERALAPVHAAAKGEAAWPPLSLFKALLIAVWHDLSDVKLAEALDDRASFRRFYGVARHEAVPERTTFVRFRRELVRLGLDRALFEAVTRQLDAEGVAVRTGTLIDATVITSATQEDDEAGWSGHQRRRAVHGYKAHVAADTDTALVVEVAVTPGNVHDGRAGVAVVPDARLPRPALRRGGGDEGRHGACGGDGLLEPARRHRSGAAFPCQERRHPICDAVPLSTRAGSTPTRPTKLGGDPVSEVRAKAAVGSRVGRGRKGRPQPTGDEENAVSRLEPHREGLDYAAARLGHGYGAVRRSFRRALHSSRSVTECSRT